MPLVFGLLSAKVTDISNICHLVSFVKYFDLEKGKRYCFYLLFRSFELLNQHVT